MQANGVLVLFLALTMSSLCASCAHSTQGDEKDKLEIIELEKEWAAAGPARDTGAYERILADDFIGQWQDGSSSNKSETIDSLQTSDEYDAVTLGDLNVRFFNGAAVVNGRFSERAMIGGKDWTGEYSFVDVWVKREGRWQCVAFQSTRISKQPH